MIGLYVYECPTCKWMVGSTENIKYFQHPEYNSRVETMSESQEMLFEPQEFKNHKMNLVGWFVIEIARPMIETRQKYIKERMYEPVVAI